METQNERIAMIQNDRDHMDPVGLYVRLFRFYMISLESQIPLQKNICNNFDALEMNWQTCGQRWQLWQGLSGEFSMLPVDWRA